MELHHGAKREDGEEKERRQTLMMMKRDIVYPIDKARGSKTENHNHIIREKREGEQAEATWSRRVYVVVVDGGRQSPSEEIVRIVTFIFFFRLLSFSPIALSGSISYRVWEDTRSKILKSPEAKLNLSAAAILRHFVQSLYIYVYVSRRSGPLRRWSCLFCQLSHPVMSLDASMRI